MKVLLFGTFDHIHPGHKYVFEEAKKRGDVVIVLARDTSVKKIKGRLPDHSELERKKQVEAVCPDADVLLGDEHDYMIPIRDCGADLLLLGYDQKMPPGIHMEDLHIKVERLKPFKPELYKSSIEREKKKMRNK